MSWPIRDLVLYTGSIYGIAWLVTKSKIFYLVRESLRKRPFWGSLLQCIVCTATWVNLAAMALLPSSNLFSDRFRVTSITDVAVLTGWVLGSTWMVARVLGDAATTGVGEQE